MAKFCPSCGNGLDESAKFCMNCGTSIAAQAVQPPAPAPIPQPEQPPIYQGQLPPQYPQQPQPFPQQAQAQSFPPPPQPYPAAPQPTAKKSKKNLIIILAIVLVVFVGGIAAAIVGIAGAVGKAGKVDYYELGDDRIPSVKLVLGEERKVTSSSTSISNGTTTKEYKYSVPGTEQNVEMFNYFTYLHDEDGFLKLDSIDFSGSSGTGTVARNSVDDGYCLTLEITYDTSGYTITIVKAEGTITPEAEGLTEPYEPYEPITEPYEPLTTAEWVGVWRHEFDDEDGVHVELVFLNEDGTFAVLLYFRDGQKDDYELYGSYSLENDTLLFYDVVSDQGDAYDDMTFDVAFIGDTMQWGGNTDYDRVADIDLADVLFDPFQPYP